MKIIERIYFQLDGFFKAGKILIPAKNRTELLLSRIIAILLIGICLLTLVFLNFGVALPSRIYLRIIINIGPLVYFIIIFYKGLSIKL